MNKKKIQLEINGVQYEGEAEPRRLLSDFIRDDLGLHGTHVGCEHGVCGACTIQWDGNPVRACLMFAVQANGARLRTVEGMAPDRTISIRFSRLSPRCMHCSAASARRAFL